MNLPKKKAIKKFIPIYQKVSPVKLMGLVKAFELICGAKFNCQVYTNTQEGCWIFRYIGASLIQITIGFHNNTLERDGFICIYDFSIPHQYKKERIEDRILATIINSVKHWDFEKIVFISKNKDNSELFYRNGFKPKGNGEMSLTLKTLFIQY